MNTTGTKVTIVAVLVLLGIGAVLFYQNYFSVSRAAAARIFFYDPAKDTDASGNILCSEQGIVPTMRAIEADEDDPVENRIRAALKALIEEGETDAETVAGLQSEFPLPEVELESVTFAEESGHLDVSIRDPLGKTSGGSCRATILRLQVEKTARGFSEVRTVSILPETLFQP